MSMAKVDKPQPFEGQQRIHALNLRHLPRNQVAIAAGRDNDRVFKDTEPAATTR